MWATVIRLGRSTSKLYCLVLIGKNETKQTKTKTKKTEKPKKKQNNLRKTTITAKQNSL